MGFKLSGELRLWTDGLLSDDVYIGLHTADPTSANELTGNSYARVRMQEGDWTINQTNGTASNTDVIQFPTPTGAWADATHWGMWTAATGGTLLWSDDFSNNPNAPAIGQDVEIAAGQLTLSFPTD